MKIDCTHERQTYFGTMLPCPRVGCDYGTRAPTYSMAVRSREPVATYVKLTFQRNFDNGHWTPIPCIDAHADQALTEKLQLEGLEGALIYGATKPAEPASASGAAIAAMVKTADAWPTVGKATHAKLQGLGAWLPEAPTEASIVKAIAKVRKEIAKAQADCMKAAYEPQFMMTEHKTLRAPEAQSLGQPLSCLQAIQARKPPEPWRPSVDEWDLLPDAGSR